PASARQSPPISADARRKLEEWVMIASLGWCGRADEHDAGAGLFTMPLLDCLREGGPEAQLQVEPVLLCPVLKHDSVGRLGQLSGEASTSRSVFMVVLPATIGNRCAGKLGDNRPHQTTGGNKLSAATGRAYE